MSANRDPGDKPIVIDDRVVTVEDFAGEITEITEGEAAEVASDTTGRLESVVTAVTTVTTEFRAYISRKSYGHQTRRWSFRAVYRGIFGPVTAADESREIEPIGAELEMTERLRRRREDPGPPPEPMRMVRWKEGHLLLTPAVRSTTLKMTVESKEPPLPAWTKWLERKKSN